MFVTAMSDACSQPVIEWRQFRQHNGHVYVEDEIGPWEPLRTITLPPGSGNEKWDIRVAESPWWGVVLHPKKHLSPSKRGELGLDDTEL